MCVPKDKDILFYNYSIMIQVKKTEVDTIWSYPHPYSDFIIVPMMYFIAISPQIYPMNMHFACLLSLI